MSLIRISLFKIFQEITLLLLGDIEVVFTRLMNHFPTRTWGHFTSKPLFLMKETFLNLKRYHLVQTSFFFKFQTVFLLLLFDIVFSSPSMSTSKDTVIKYFITSHSNHKTTNVFNKHNFLS